MGVGPDEESRRVSPGNKDWRRLVFVGWALFAVSFVLPAYSEGRLFPPPPGADDPPPVVETDPEPGWAAFLNALLFGEPTGRASALTNLLVLASLATLRTKWTRRRLVGGRWLPLVLGAAGILNLVYWPIWVAGNDSVAQLLVGYWVWAVSFVGVAVGLWMLAREQDCNVDITM